jgi:hypothetical protein
VAAPLESDRRRVVREVDGPATVVLLLRDETLQFGRYGLWFEEPSHRPVGYGSEVKRRMNSSSRPPPTCTSPLAGMRLPRFHELGRLGVGVVDGVQDCSAKANSSLRVVAHRP